MLENAFMILFLAQNLKIKQEKNCSLGLLHTVQETSRVAELSSLDISTLDGISL